MSALRRARDDCSIVVLLTGNWGPHIYHIAREPNESREGRVKFQFCQPTNAPVVSINSVDLVVAPQIIEEVNRLIHFVINLFRNSLRQLVQAQESFA